MIKTPQSNRLPKLSIIVSTLNNGQKLLDTIWGYGIFIEDRTVDVHMSRLRKALRIKETDTDLIRTVRDGGYGLLKS